MRQAVVVIHGMGEPRPMSFLRGLLDAAIGIDTHYWSHPDKMSRSYELRRLIVPAEAERSQTDFYEYYWAHHMKGNALSDLVPPVSRLMLRAPWRVPGSMRLLWVILWVSAAFVGLAAYTWGAEALFEDPKTWIKGNNAGWLAAGAAAAAGFVRKFLVSHFADVTRYVNASPRNVEIRQKIRSEAVDLLRELHKSGKYDRIVLLCHSLGSFVGLDALRELWHEVHQCHGVTSTADQPALDAIERIGEELKEAAARGDLEAATELRVAYREAQHDLFQEQRRLGNPWLITDFVTAGSPLIGSTFLLAKDAAELDTMQRARELPTCPPVNEKPASGDPSYSFRMPSGGPRLLHQGAFLGPVRWTNTWYPSYLGVFGDWFGGPLAPLYGPGIEDIPATKGKWTRLIPFWGHVRYFAWADESGEGTSVAAIRSGIDLGQAQWLQEIAAVTIATDWTVTGCAQWERPTEVT